VARTIATGLDPGARTAIVNLTAVAPSADTHLTAWAAGPVPATSNLNLPAGDTRANLAIVPLAPDGTFRLRNNSGTTHVVIDLIGSYGDGGWRFRPVTPTRTLDTRPAGFATTPTLVPMPTLPTGTRAAVTNLTGIFPTTATHLTMWAAGTTTPTSNLNLPAGDVRANQVITRIDPDHPAATLANASGTTNAAVDLIGYLG
ncbi:MAG: hypothetical protein KDB33_18325, partial [Acidimicrobiales bacterium]|nr:hypothetical protein [Acidimicrobiales bacterium]